MPWRKSIFIYVQLLIHLFFSIYLPFSFRQQPLHNRRRDIGVKDMQKRGFARVSTASSSCLPQPADRPVGRPKRGEKYRARTGLKGKQREQTAQKAGGHQHTHQNQQAA